MHPLILLGIALVVPWLLALVAKVIGFAIHLLLIVAVVMIAWGLLQRGARKVGIGAHDRGPGER